MTTPSDPFGGAAPQGPDEPAPGSYGTPPQGYGQPPPGYGGSGYGAPSPFGRPDGAQLAAWGSRVGAFLLDAALYVGLILFAYGLASLVGVVSEPLAAVVMGLGFLGAFSFLFWQLWVQGETGQTLGKKKVGIRLLREQDGQPIGGGLSIARYFVHLLDSIPCYVGYLWPLWDGKKQTFADKALNTLVVRA